MEFRHISISFKEPMSEHDEQLLQQRFQESIDIIRDQLKERRQVIDSEAAQPNGFRRRIGRVFASGLSHVPFANIPLKAVKDKIASFLDALDTMVFTKVSPDHKKISLIYCYSELAAINLQLKGRSLHAFHLLQEGRLADGFRKFVLPELEAAAEVEVGRYA